MSEMTSFEQQTASALRHFIGQELPARLLPKILFQIRRQEEAAAKRRLVFFALFFMATLIFTAFAWNLARLQFSQSGITQILGLIFSDFSTVLANWKEFSLSLLESLPVLPAALALGSVMGLLVLFKSVVQTARQTISLAHK